MLAPRRAGPGGAHLRLQAQCWVENGEEIIIARAGKPIARLCPLPKRRRRRVLGKYAGQIDIADDFDELPDELAEALGARG